jgi:hypothetical protein
MQDYPNYMDGPANSDVNILYLKKAINEKCPIGRPIKKICTN